MLTDGDIEWIKANREQLTHNRTVLIEVIHLIDGEIDPYTGDATKQPVPETVEATWRRYTSQSPGSNDISFVNGVRVESGDCITEFGLSVDLSDVKNVKFDGETYEIQAKDKIGLGDVNRHYVLVRRVF